MKQLFLNLTINFLEKHNDYSEMEIKKLRYGLEGIYLTITKLLIVFIISLFLGIIKEVILIIILFNVIRFFGFGFHAEKSYECLLLSIFNFIIIPLIFINVDTSLSTNLIIAGVCIIIFLIFAPADTVKRPLPNKKKRIIRKVLTTLTAIVYIIAMVLINKQYFSDLFLSSLVIQVIVINPLTYMLFKQPYNNYKKIK